MNRPHVYLSSSWKNRVRVRAFAEALRLCHLTPYDFTDPRCRQTPEIPPEKYPCLFDPAKHVYGDYLNVPEWRTAVETNQRAIDACLLAVLLLPCGLDAHADWGYAVGRGKKTAIVGAPPAGERVPTHLWADAFCKTDLDALAWCCRTMQVDPPSEDARMKLVTL